MKKYRIVKVSRFEDKPIFRVQRRVLFFFWEHVNTWVNEVDARKQVEELKHKPTKQILK